MTDTEAIGPPIFESRDLSKVFGGLHALSTISLTFYEGEVFGLIGPNGSGKTTFLNVVSGVYVPTSGAITFLDRDLDRDRGRPDRIARRGIARTFQGIRLIQERTVLDNVMLGAYLRQHTGLVPAVLNLTAARKERNQIEEETRVLLDELDISELADREVGSLPYGPQRKVEIARALISKPRLLLLDEPTAGMTPVERTEIFDLVADLRSRRVTAVVVEHDVDSIKQYCHRSAVLNFGEVIALGPTARVIEEEAVIDAYIGRGARR